MRANIIRPLFSAASVTQRAAVCTCFISCSAGATSFASQAIASLSVRNFLPSGNSIGSSNGLDQDKLREFPCCDL